MSRFATPHPSSPINSPSSLLQIPVTCLPNAREIRSKGQRTVSPPPPPSPDARRTTPMLIHVRFAGAPLKRSESMDSVGSQAIAFATAVTPDTYLDPPSPQDPPAEGMLFPPPATDLPSPSRRVGHAKKKPENHIPRPPNAFILFRSSFIKNQHVSSEVETNHSTLSKIIGLTWQNLPHEERQIWHSKAKIALEEHKRKFPQYAFRPCHAKGKATEKRKVREVGPKDLKRCEKIAELLVEGKKGAELDAAIAEFDRHHVPLIVTRFEAPITARSFRRSSSAPAPDTEHSNPPFLSAEATSSKPRAMSSQPEVTSTPSPEQVRAPQSEYDASESEGSFCTTPSSPYPSTPFPETNPSFVSTRGSCREHVELTAFQDLSTFSFTTTASSTPMPTCDPLCSLPAIQTQFDYNNVFSQESPLSYSPTHDVYGPLDVSFHSPQQPYYEQYSSPMSSMPGTPCEPQPIYSPMPHAPSRVALGHFEQPYDLFAPTPAYAAAAGMCAPFDAHVHMAAPDFSMNSKLDLACYERASLAPYDASGLSPPFPAPVPTYRM